MQWNESRCNKYSMKHAYRAHWELESVSFSLYLSFGKLEVRHKNKTNTDIKPERHINYVYNLCHTPGSKKHTKFIFFTFSLTRSFLSVSFYQWNILIFHLHFTNQIVNWAVATQMMNGKLYAYCLPDDSFHLGKASNGCRTRSTKPSKWLMVCSHRSSSLDFPLATAVCICVCPFYSKTWNS